ncbi:MAG: hypothetical protein JRJ86_02630 [Deltaproteobacteria bacterium]|nr:hypothetical protein [Deltaproteobacteria bacterium]MBW2116659.1 hypothetical protein [Deltaproteobacteria bacterium]MBW2343232.1 hypothetical protein [Deltaproteobacteria bacterium]
MNDKFEAIIRTLISKTGEQDPLTGIDIIDQFRPEETTPESAIRNLNSAFLISLCGQSHPFYSHAEHFIKALGKERHLKDAFDFYRDGLALVRGEIKKRYAGDTDFRENLDKLYDWIKKPDNFSRHIETIDMVWRVFFPEGVSLLEDRVQNIEALRKKRRIRIHGLNPDPIQEPAKEILFTSNVLLTLPLSAMPIDGLALSDKLKQRLKQVKKESQLYWYDHPIPIGVDPAKNEVIYGLQALDEAIAFEKERGTVEKDTKAHCILSISVTHAGLQDVAKAYLEEMFKDVEGLDHLRIYALTESDTSRLVSEVFAPAAKHFFGLEDSRLLHEIIGVDGEYGRHYSLLKAIAALWQVLLDPCIKATFKIDLDQVFPQQELVKESGLSALDHFKTPLWGAEGEDGDGNRVELGMIAGALVNQEDIPRSLFTPDVVFPDETIKGDEWIFFSRLPQALSTEAEMMTRYENGLLNGRDRCLQRIHVTGGTCGILVKSLRRHRPFTPGFIGRAEDQAYILSVLFRESTGNLRYVHKDGLIMRHDKDAFAVEAIRSAKTGKLIGDYVRILMFSHYAKALPWPVEKTKHCIDPFTGCFVSHIPFTVVYLRLALQGALYFNEGKPKEGFELLQMGTTRLHRIIKELGKTPDYLKERYMAEKKAWNTYYDILDRIEDGIKERDPFTLDMKEKAETLTKDCEIDL